MPKLKVFRTAAGFHDAYVAASSRKAALAAWGADKDLFARGMAEEVTDPALAEAPLATPGEVIKVSRGGREAQLAALPVTKPAKPSARSASAGRAKSQPAPEIKAKSKPKPKPSREPLDATERALAAAEARHEDQRTEIAKEEAALERRRREIKEAQENEIARLEQDRTTADAAYREALAKWRNAASG